MEKIACIGCGSMGGAIMSAICKKFDAKNITVTAISILGFSAMAGLVGGGGLGDLAYRYGYQRYQTDIMIVCVLILIVLVQLIQWAGDFAVRKTDKKL